MGDSKEHVRFKERESVRTKPYERKEHQLEKKPLWTKNILCHLCYPLSGFRSVAHYFRGIALGVRFRNFGDSLNGNDAIALRNPSVLDYWGHCLSCARISDRSDLHELYGLLVSGLTARIRHCHQRVECP